MKWVFKVLIGIVCPALLVLSAGWLEVHLLLAASMGMLGAALFIMSFAIEIWEGFEALFNFLNPF